MNHTRSAVVGAVAMILAVVIPAAAQSTTGTIVGNVKDAQGGVIPGAAVTLVSETLNTQSGEVFTNDVGEFVIANVRPDRYTVRVTQDGFKTLLRGGITVSLGDRVGLGTLTIELGTLNETVVVTGESPLIQSESGDRSFTVPLETVSNLPIADRTFASLVTLTPGVQTNVGNNGNVFRLGGGGGNNITMDGVGAIDTSNNRAIMQINTESVSEVKVLTSNYAAEYGRSSGLQITLTTKSGTNQFSGSAYTVFRNSSWNANSKTNILNGDAKPEFDEKDLGYSIGGPIGRPGGNNKLFFFYSHEFEPRTSTNNGGFLPDVQRFRVPTALERQGDFSQSVDNNGNVFPFIQDPLLPRTCSATNTTNCFRDGGVLGRIPAGRLYQPGMNILNLWPSPNVNIPGAAYNYEQVLPEQSLMSNQPVFKVDYLPLQNLRTTFKLATWHQQKKSINGSIPGFNDSAIAKPFVFTMAATGSWTINPTMFLEATFGRTGNDQTGCSMGAQNGVGPVFCNAGLPTNASANRNAAGLGALPLLYPEGAVLDPDYYAYDVVTNNWFDTPIWDGRQWVAVPNFTWGGRVSGNNPSYAPPNEVFPGYINMNRTVDVTASLTKVWGSHTVKVGFYDNYSRKHQYGVGWNGTIDFSNSTNNPLDSGFGYSNAALGVFNSYAQLSRYAEGKFVYNQIEAYVQDNWKVNSRLSLAYGLRFVNQPAQYDAFDQQVNFLPDRWVQAAAPTLYAAGCVNGANPCSGTNRQAMDPRTKQLLGPTSIGLVGTTIPGTGDALNGLFEEGSIAKGGYVWPKLGVAPRFGAAYDLTGNQDFVLRGGAGVFYDRPGGNPVYNLIRNPPSVTAATLRFGTLSALADPSAVGLPAPALFAFEYKMDLPTSVQWNGGFQKLLPWNSAIDVGYVGQHSYNQLVNGGINNIDFGSAFLPKYQDPTLAASATPGASAVSSDLMRAMTGYGTITSQVPLGWSTFHSLQLSFNRRYTNGLSFGFNDTIVLAQHQNSTPRYNHNADGSFVERADQAEADKLLGQFIENKQVFKGNFVWAIPASAQGVLGAVINNWQLAGIFTGQTGTTYSMGYSYQSGGGNVNLTGSPDYAARVRIVGDTGKGCSSDATRQFNTSAFQGPLSGSLGLESGSNYMTGCFEKNIDFSISKNITLANSKALQFRLDIFNAFNFAGITGRNTTLALTSPTDPVTATNLPYDANGNPIAARVVPSGAGFGVANAYQLPRRLQAYMRFAF